MSSRQVEKAPTKTVCAKKQDSVRSIKEEEEREREQNVSELRWQLTINRTIDYEEASLKLLLGMIRGNTSVEREFLSRFESSRSGRTRKEK